ncbi:MAG TPA: M56 family metallopeptidase [Gemmatimonadota bacterium]|nr:M56 family metallopeptidase [Gemmatimonadota bacterium]
MSPVELAQPVAEASLRASIALGAVLVLRRLLVDRTSARARRALILAAVLAVPLLPLAEVALPGIALEWAGPVHLTPLTGSLDRPGADAAPLAALPSLAVVAAAVWLFGAVVMLARLGAGLFGAARTVGASAPVADPAWLDERDRLAARLGLGRRPSLRLAREERVPMAWGIRRPAILVPPSALGWSAARRRAVLAHELGHLARREPLARIAAEAVRAIHWFDPLLRRAVARLRAESELAADEVAIGLGIDPRDYADHLVALAREKWAAPPGGFATAFAEPGGLDGRVEAILAAGVSDGRRLGAPRAALAGVAAIGLAAVLLTALPRITPVPSPVARLAARYGIPADLAGEILASARLEGIVPAVAFGLVAEESGFDPGRVSPAGAVGLTQVLPSTARGVRPGISDPELRDVTTNLRVGFRYLRRQIDRQGGDVTGGLLAYSIGPTRLEELRRSGAPVPDDYATRVLSHAD